MYTPCEFDSFAEREHAPSLRSKPQAWDANASLLIQLKALSSKRLRCSRAGRRSKQIAQACPECEGREGASSCRACLRLALASCDVSPESSAFMHAHVFRVMRSAVIPRGGVVCVHQLAPQALRHVRAEPNVVQALYNACREQQSMPVFEAFVRLFIESTVLLQDLRDSGYEFPPGRHESAYDVMQHVLAAFHLLFRS